MSFKSPFNRSNPGPKDAGVIERREQGTFPETPRETNRAFIRGRADRQAKPSFRRTDIASIDPQELDSYADRIVYQTLPWIKFIAHTQHAEPVLGR